MFDKYIRTYNLLKNKDTEISENKRENYGHESLTISKKLSINIENIKRLLGKSDDVVFREFSFGVNQQIKAFICFIDGLGDKKLINEYIVKSLMVNVHLTDQYSRLVEKGNVFEELKKYILNVIEMSETGNIDEALNGILSGNTVLFIDGYNKAYIISAKGGESRGIEQPETEVVVRGSREGFTETLRVNTSLLRKIIKNTDLVFESFRIGKQTHTDISIAYINGIANKEIVEEVKRRLNRIETDAILESGYIEQFIEDHPFSPFSLLRNSERPDKVAAKLLEGRVAIFCDGTPFVLTLPHLFIECLQIPEDYYNRTYFGTFVRLIRFLAFVITLTTPALYVALETFNQEMVPPVLLITAASAREGIPFPAFIETLLMVVVFELLRESGIRLPRQVGQAVSIVGALVIGEAAVRAGIISAPMVIIGAITGVTSFIVPALAEPVIIFRFLLLFLGAAFGLFGVSLGLIFMLGHMCSLKSFGVPYLTPFAPLIKEELKDTFIRAPLWKMKYRPKSVTWQDAEKHSSYGIRKKPDSKRGGKS